MTFKAFTNPKAITKLSDINTRRLREVELPSVNGTGTARAIATVYGELAIGGPKLGVRRATLDELERSRPATFDVIFGIESAFALGFMKPFPLLPFGSSPKAYGHTGSGGSFGCADPDAHIGYAYVMNRAGYSLPTDQREIALRTALSQVLG
jgi:CubicO group peptidase (beta-lactamase class C family)